MRPVAWTDEARRDLLGIVEYIAQNNPSAAERAGESILTSADDLGAFAIGHQGRVSGTYEKSVSDLPYTISYAIDTRARKSGVIAILRIIHDARHWPAEAWPQ